MGEITKNTRNSMTGFGRGRAENDKVSVTVDAKSLNHRYLEIFTKIQKEYVFVEEEIRNIIKENIKRGKLEIIVNITPKEGASDDIKLNIMRAKAYKNALDILKSELQLFQEINVANIVKFPDVIVEGQQSDEMEESVKECIVTAVNIAISSLCDMRKIEGEKLVLDIEKRADILKKNVEEVKKQSENLPKEYAEKLRNRLNELMDVQMVSEERIAQEVAIFADKASITEEIVRLESHIAQLKSILNAEEQSVGKKIDFLVQEMNREANTIGSKAGKLEITNLSLDMKSEIEKIREQIQNLE